MFTIKLLEDNPIRFQIENYISLFNSVARKQGDNDTNLPGKDCRRLKANLPSSLNGEPDASMT